MNEFETNSKSRNKYLMPSSNSLPTLKVNKIITQHAASPVSGDAFMAKSYLKQGKQVVFIKNKS